MKKKKKTFKVLDLWDAGNDINNDWNERVSIQFKNDAKEYTRALKAGINFLDKRISRAQGTRGDIEDFEKIYKDIKGTKISEANWEKANALTNKWRNFVSNDISELFAENIRRSSVNTAKGRTYVNISNSVYTRTGNYKKRKRQGRTSHERIASHNEKVAAWKLYKTLVENGEDVDLKTGIADFVSPYILALVSIYENMAGHRLNIITDIEEVDTGETYRAVSFRFNPKILKSLRTIAEKIEKEKDTQIKVYTNKYENFRKLPKK